MAGRWTTTGKIAVGVLVVAGACSVVWGMRSIQPREAEMGQPTPTPQATDSVQIPPEEAAYQRILEGYEEVLHADSQAFLEHPEAYFQGDHAILQLYHRNHTKYQGDSFFYAYDDLDDNGTEELLIGFGWDDWINENPGAARVVDLYGFNGATAVASANSDQAQDS